MKLPITLGTLATLAMLAGCGGKADLFDVSPPAVTEKVRIAFRSVELREVSLPSYAAADEIHMQASDGTMVSASDASWADSPERAVALELSQHLAQITGRPVASDPWPFEAFPDARLDVRFTRLLPSEDGQYMASGQYFVAVPDGRRERSGLFELSVAFDPSGGPDAIAAARGQLIVDLASYIAKNGLK